MPANIGTMNVGNVREATLQYEDNKTAFKNYSNLEAQLKQQILAAVDHEYLSPLADDTLGFLNITSRAMLEHLHDTYGAINTDDLEKNFERLSAPWDPTTPIKTVFTRSVPHFSRRNCL